MTRLGELSFEEKYLPRTGNSDTLGMWLPEGIIIVNPIPHTVDTIIHECLHELFQNYSEHAIRTLTGKVTKQLTEEETQAIYSEYRRKVDE